MERTRTDNRFVRAWARRCWAGALLLLLLGGLVPGSLRAQATDDDQGTGINRNFVDPEVARQRKIEHNNFFVRQEADPEKQPNVILDLQTSAYALKERPAGLTYDVYSAIGYSLATSMMVVGPRTDADGNRRVIIIDTLEDSSAARQLAQDYLALYKARGYGTPAKLPIDAIIYTHNHIDHTGGVLGYLAEADKEACPAQDPDVRGLGGSYTARANCIEIVCQEKVVDAVVNTSTVSGRIINARSMYMYGTSLRNNFPSMSPSNPLPIGEAITNGIGPYLSRGIATFRLPSRTFAEEMEFTAAGVNMELVYVPSETSDELAVFVPDTENGASGCPVVERKGGCASGLLFSAEVIQGPAFPNLYSLRGTQYRSPADWFASVDKLRTFDSWCMVPSHGPPVCQRDNISLLLSNFRDAVQFTHDQTVRFMNKGYTPDELVELVKVPDEVVTELSALVPWSSEPGTGALRGPVHTEDYLLPFYGSVPQGVREIYFGYVGWFNADPVNLSPIPPTEAAERMVKLIGSGQPVLEAASKAMDEGDYQWAAELATLALRADPKDADARNLKADAYIELGRRAFDPNWSDWYFTAANELRATPGECFLPFLPVGLISPRIQVEVPIADWVNSLTFKLDGQKAAAAGASATLGFWFIPTQQDFGTEGYLLQLRHGIAQFSSWTGTQHDFLDQTTVAVQMSQQTLDELIVASAGLETLSAQGVIPKPLADVILAALAAGKVTLLKGTREDLASYFSYFEPWPVCQPPLAVPRV